MDTTKKFDGRAEEYTVSRPGYAPALIEYLYRHCGISKDSVVADVGSGTGKFTKYLLDRGSTVYAVEPNDDMRNAADKELKKYPNRYSISAAAENTTLPDHFVDFVTVAQAFHWFDMLGFQKECRRILKESGQAVLVWNIRNCEAALTRELYRICETYCPSFQGFNGGIQKDDERIAAFFESEYEYAAFDYPLVFDREKFIARSLSSSYSLKENEYRYDRYIRALNTLFDKYERNGVVSVENSSVVYSGRVWK